MQEPIDETSKIIYNNKSEKIKKVEEVYTVKIIFVIGIKEWPGGAV